MNEGGIVGAADTLGRGMVFRRNLAGCVLAAVSVLALAACIAPSDDDSAPVRDTAPVPAPQTTNSSSPASAPIAPITGYGDFTEYGPNEIDDVMVMERIAACVAGQGFPMYFDPIEGMEIDGELPPEQSAQISDVLEACTAGLNLPTRELTRDEIGERYEFMLFSVECLRGQGWDVGEPPTREEWIDAWPYSWSPVDALPSLAVGDGLELDGCPLRFRVDWESWDLPSG